MKTKFGASFDGDTRESEPLRKVVVVEQRGSIKYLLDQDSKENLIEERSGYPVSSPINGFHEYEFLGQGSRTVLIGKLGSMKYPLRWNGKKFEIVTNGFFEISLAPDAPDEKKEGVVSFTGTTAGSKGTFNLSNDIFLPRHLDLRI